MINDLFNQIKQNTLAIITWITASGLLTFILTKYFERTNERRQLFAKAYRAALAWREMLYRVRRRDGLAKTDRELINKFHDLQEEIDYYQGLISVESKSLGQSYSTFVQEVKDQTGGLIVQAWRIKKTNPTKKLTKEQHPNISEAAEAFLQDTRDWLNFWQIPKFSVWRRNKA